MRFFQPPALHLLRRGPGNYAKDTHSSRTIKIRKTGEGGIRTHGDLAATNAFQTFLIVHSSTSPRVGLCAPTRAIPDKGI